MRSQFGSENLAAPAVSHQFMAADSSGTDSSFSSGYRSTFGDSIPTWFGESGARSTDLAGSAHTADQSATIASQSGLSASCILFILFSGGC